VPGPLNPGIYSGRTMRIALFGDIHGYWCDFRDVVVELNSKAPLDLVLQCGDAQPIRDEIDLEYMRCPKKYRKRNRGHSCRKCLTITFRYENYWLCQD